jgi:hypothetical protein
MSVDYLMKKNDSLKEICSSNVEQLQFGLQSLFSQDDVQIQDK